MPQEQLNLYFKKTATGLLLRLDTLANRTLLLPTSLCLNGGKLSTTFIAILAFS